LKSMKELKSVKIVPFTLMSSSLSAVWAFVFALVFLVLGSSIGAILSGTQLAPLAGILVGISIAGLVVFPVGTFLLSITSNFLYALLYNLLVPKLGGIKFEIDDLKEITKAEIVPVAMIIAAVSAVFQFIIQLVMAPLQASIIGLLGGISTVGLTQLTNTTTGQIPTLGVAGAFGAILNIIISPIITFIMVFVGVAIAVFLFNFLAPKVGGIKLELEQMADNYFGLASFNPVQLGLISGAVAAVIGLIIGILALILFIVIGALGGSIAGGLVAGIVMLLAYTIGGFVIIFITYALTAVFYNVLAPKVGSIKVKLE
jgi:hypothetical protein